jgi:protein SCO1/2
MAHQEEDPKNVLILGIGVGSLVTIVATMFILGSYYDILRDGEQQRKVFGRENPDLVTYNKVMEQRQGPNAYAVVDPKKGKVRIPIDRAITLLAQRGRDGIPSIQPDPTLQVIAPPGGAAPAASASAAPAASGSAPPAASASAPPAASSAAPAGSAPAPKHLAKLASDASPPYVPPMKAINALLLAAALMFGAGVARADHLREGGGLPADTVPPELADVGVTEHLGEQLPKDVTLRDETGKTVTIADLVRDRPVVVSFVYHSCPTLCTFVQSGFAASVKDVPWSIGKDYDVLTISIDPRDTTAIANEKKERFVKGYGRDEATTAKGWHFLTGDEPQVKRLARALGFSYHFDARQSQFAHSAAIFVVTPTGKIARYLYGIDFPPKDLRLALAEAAEGRSISTVDHLLLYCYQYDPNARGYVVVAQRVMRIGAAISVVLLGSFLGLMWRRERKRAAADELIASATPPGEPHPHPQG